MDVGNDTTTSNGGLDEDVQLFVTSDGEQKMSGGDSAHLEVLGGITREFEDFSSEILKNSSSVDC